MSGGGTGALPWTPIPETALLLYLNRMFTFSLAKCSNPPPVLGL